MDIKGKPNLEFRNETKNFSVSALDKKNKFEGKEIGSVLNQISDPNWKDKGDLVKGHGNATLDKDAFIKLFLAQLENQDPMNPLENHEMAAQLAQFTSLEKLENIKTGIDNLTTTEKSRTKFNALNLIGKEIESDSSSVLKQKRKEEAALSFSLAKPAARLKVTISDKTGAVIKEMGKVGLMPGQHEIIWKGDNNMKQDVLEGEYRVQYEAFDNEGKKVGVTTRKKGVVTGVNFIGNTAVLMVGNQKVKLSEVRTFSNPVNKKLASVPQPNPSGQQGMIIKK